MTVKLELVVLGALCATASGCTSGEGMARERVQLASLQFDVPATWQRSDHARRGVATAVWQPEDNDRKESITVIRTELSPAVAKAGAAAIEPYLAHAQRSLPHARTSPVKRTTTAKGLTGARVDLDFVPEGQSEKYRRVHVVLVDGSSLVHVLYTAKHPDRDLGALGVVLCAAREQLPMGGDDWKMQSQPNEHDCDRMRKGAMLRQLVRYARWPSLFVLVRRGLRARRGASYASR